MKAEPASFSSFPLHDLAVRLTLKKCSLAYFYFSFLSWQLQHALCLRKRPSSSIMTKFLYRVFVGEGVGGESEFNGPKVMFNNRRYKLNWPALVCLYTYCNRMWDSEKFHTSFISHWTILIVFFHTEHVKFA